MCSHSCRLEGSAKQKKMEEIQRELHTRFMDLRDWEDREMRKQRHESLKEGFSLAFVTPSSWKYNENFTPHLWICGIAPETPETPETREMRKQKHESLINAPVSSVSVWPSSHLLRGTDYDITHGMKFWFHRQQQQKQQ
jgi:hypothetical protein